MKEMNPKDITEKSTKVGDCLISRDKAGRIVIDDREEIAKLNEKLSEKKENDKIMKNLKKKDFLSLPKKEKTAVYEHNIEKINTVIKELLDDDWMIEATKNFFDIVLEKAVKEFGINDQKIIEEMKKGLGMADDADGALRKIRHGFEDAIPDAVWCVTCHLDPES
jgi:hypothetical protein